MKNIYRYEAQQITAMDRGSRNPYSSGCKTMNERTEIKLISLLVLLAVFVFAPSSRAQTEDQKKPGINTGNYDVHETIEVGYRKDWITGNPDTFETFVDLNTGMRLLDYNLSMRSRNHQGILFDNLTFSNFGYGGDPENVSRLRVEKNKWYDFSLVFRRHKDFWDYNLLANPLNPNLSNLIGTTISAVNPTAGLNANMFPSFAVNNSPHSLYLVRRMQDYDLTLLPQSRARFRLGYSRDVNEGPSLSSFAGTLGVTNFSFPLEQSFRMTTNAYHLGVDFRVLPRTTISYDQFLEYNKNDTSDTLANTPFLVKSPTFPGTVPVNMGLAWYYPPVNSGTPCGFSNNPIQVTNTANPAGSVPPFLGATSTVLGYANPLCKEATSYLRTAPARNFMPTERLSFQSTYFKRLEMSGSASYNSSKNTIANLYDAINEWANPSVATGQIREGITSGSASARQVAARANWSGIITLTQKIRLVDSINYDNWRTSGVFNQVTTDLFAMLPQVAGQTGILLPISQFAVGAASGPAFASICPAAPYNASTCPQHGSSSLPDVYKTFNKDFLGQERLSNTVQLQADLTKRVSARIGYLYEQRQISETPWLSLYYSSATNPNMGATYYPGGGGTAGALQQAGATGNYYNAARGVCAVNAGALRAECRYNPADGSITYSPTLMGSTDSTTYCQQGTHTATPNVSITNVFLGRCTTTINEQVGLAGLTLRPMDTLRIFADFQFGYNDAAYVRTGPRQVQSYKVHANYQPRPWITIDGSIDIHENRDNVSEINNLEHGRTYGFDAIFARNTNLAFTVGYNYTNISLQEMIAFRDNFSASTSISPPNDTLTSTGYLFYTPTTAACPAGFVSATGDGPGNNASINLCTTAFYTSRQHYAYGDVTWKPLKRVTASLGYAGTFVGGSSVFLNPLQPAGTLAFNYQKPFASAQIDLYKGLSYKTSWNYYAYNSRAPINPTVTVPAGSGTYAGQTYALQPIAAPDFNGSTLLFALRYAF